MIYGTYIYDMNIDININGTTQHCRLIYHSITKVVHIGKTVVTTITPPPQKKTQKNKKTKKNNNNNNCYAQGLYCCILLYCVCGDGNPSASLLASAENKKLTVWLTVINAGFKIQ